MGISVLPLQLRYINIISATFHNFFKKSSLWINLITDIYCFGVSSLSIHQGYHKYLYCCFHFISNISIILILNALLLGLQWLPTLLCYIFAFFMTLIEILDGTFQILFEFISHRNVTVPPFEFISDITISFGCYLFEFVRHIDIMI